MRNESARCCPNPIGIQNYFRNRIENTIWKCVFVTLKCLGRAGGRNVRAEIHFVLALQALSLKLSEKDMRKEHELQVAKQSYT